MITDHAQLLKRLPSPLFKALSQAWVDYKFPRHLFIETTATCNLACSYCPREKIKGDMDFQLFKKIVNEASQYGVRSFSLHLFGEPLLYRRWIDAINYIKAKNHKHTVLLTTNGTRINECIDKLVKLPIDKVLWTVRPEAKFTNETKSKLKKWKPFTVRIINELDNAGEYASWPRVERRRMHNYGGNISNTDTSSKNVVTGEQLAEQKKRWPCYHLFLAPAVSWNGKFLMCCADPHQKEVFGDINKDKISECWEALRKVRESHLNGQFNGICSNCDTWREYPNIFFGHEYAYSS